MFTRCGKFVYTGPTVHWLRDGNVETDQELDALVSRLECIVAIVEESFLHLLASQHSMCWVSVAEHIVRQKGGCLIRQFLYGFDDCTIPPIGNRSVSVRSGRAGPLLALNIELIEFLRSSGYTWQEVCSVIMPRCAHAQARYTVVCFCVCVCVCLCRLLQLLKDQWSASRSFYRLLVMFSWILIRGFAK